MTKNSKKTESENSENAKSTFSAITNHLVDSWEKRSEKNQQRKQSELEKKAKRSIAAKKAVQTRKRNNVSDLRSELAVLETERKGVKKHLKFIQEDLDEKLDEMGEKDNLKIDISYVQSQLEKGNFLSKFLSNKMDFFLKDAVERIFTKYFRIDYDEEDEDETELVSLQVERVLYQLELSDLEEDEKEIRNALKKLNIKPEQKTEAQLKWESQLGKCKSTEVALKKLLMRYFKDKPWYNERLNTMARKHIETDPKRRRLGITERAKNNDVTVIEDFGFNDFLGIFGYDINNNKQEYNQDLVLEVFELGDSTTITGSNRIFNMIKEIKSFENDLKHKDGKPLSGSAEDILYNDCDFIQGRIKKYLKK